MCCSKDRLLRLSPRGKSRKESGKSQKSSGMEKWRNYGNPQHGIHYPLAPDFVTPSPLPP